LICVPAPVVLTALCRCSATCTSTPPFAQPPRPTDGCTDHRLQCGPPQQHDHVVHRLRRCLWYATVRWSRLRDTEGRNAKLGDRAFDTGSEKIWNGLNKGVRKTCGIVDSRANAQGSDNGRTSSRGTWSRPRTTSSAAAHGQSGCDTGRRCDAWGRTLYVRMYSTAAKYHGEVLIILA
jgi:hypothetical protein